MTLTTIILGVIAAFVATEMLAWSERLSVWLVKRNAKYAPEHLRDRLTEEWLAELSQIPGKLSRLIWAADLRRGAFVISSRFYLPEIPTLSVSSVRCIDIVISLFLIIFMLPAYIVIAIVITVYNLTSGNSPSLFDSKPLVGFDGRAIRLLRFRTNLRRVHVDGMIVGVESFIVRALRRSGLDEIPMFFSVLNGSFSLVGPRARHLHELLKDSNSIENTRVRPGLFGLSHIRVSDGSDTLLPLRDEVKTELHYIEHYSMKLYFRILWATIRYYFRHPL